MSNRGSFVSEGRFFEPSMEELIEGCRSIKRNRLSAHEEIQDDRVELLGRDAAVLATSSAYTVRLRDGRTRVRPQVVTTVWIRSPAGWRRVHFHESWPVEDTLQGAPPDSAGVGCYVAELWFATTEPAPPSEPVPPANVPFEPPVTLALKAADAAGMADLLLLITYTVTIAS